jgi:hypothetical protein
MGAEKQTNQIITFLHTSLMKRETDADGDDHERGDVRAFCLRQKKDDPEVFDPHLFCARTVFGIEYTPVHIIIIIMADICVRQKSPYLCAGLY